MLRLGRQELPLGSGRLVSIRDAANVRLSFDAAKVTWDQGDRGSFEVLAGRPVDPKPGVFDSGTSHREWLWYADWTRRGRGDRRPNDDLFYIGRRLNGAVYRRGTRDEGRTDAWRRPQVSERRFILRIETRGVENLDIERVLLANLDQDALLDPEAGRGVTKLSRSADSCESLRRRRARALVSA